LTSVVEQFVLVKYAHIWIPATETTLGAVIVPEIVTPSDSDASTPVTVCPAVTLINVAKSLVDTPFQYSEA
jgi:hypothetical protein